MTVYSVICRSVGAMYNCFIEQIVAYIDSTVDQLLLCMFILHCPPTQTASLRIHLGNWGMLGIVV